MSNKLKRIMAVVIAVAMMLSLAACGSEVDETPAQTGGANQTQGADQTEAPTEDTFDPMEKYEDPVKLTFGLYMGGMDETDVNGGTYEDNAYLDYIKGELNIEVEYELVYKEHADYRQALSLAISSGELPDVFLVSNQATFIELASEGMIYSFDEIYEQYAGDALKSLCTSMDNALDIATYDGQLMAIPRICPPQGYYVHVRQDWVDQLGIKLDEDGDQLITLEEIEMLADAFVKNDPGKSGDPVGFSTRVKAGDGNYTLDLVNQTFGVIEFEWLRNEDGTITNGTIDTDMKEALSWWADMFDKKLLDQNFGVSGTSEVKTMFANGQMGIILGGNPNVATWLLMDSYVAHPKMKMTMYGLDNGTGKMTYCSSNPQDRWICISKECKNPEAVIKMFNLYADLFMGTADYEYIDANYPEFAATGYSYSKFDPLPLANNSVNQYRDVVTEAKAYAAGQITLDEVPEKNKVYVEAYKAVSEGSTDVNHRKYADVVDAYEVEVNLLDSGKFERTYNVAPETTEVMQLYASEIQDYAYETFVKIITGEESVDIFDAFVEEWLSRGGAAILEDLEENWTY